MSTQNANTPSEASRIAEQAAAGANLTEQLSANDRLKAEAMSILSLDHSVEAIATKHAMADRDREYEQQQRQRQQDARDRQRIESEIRAEGVFSPGYRNPEPFSEVQARLDAKERIKREAEHEGGTFTLHLD